MNTKAAHAQEQVANVVHELEIAENVPKRMGKCASIAHIADQIDTFINYVYRADEPQRRLDTERVNQA